MKLLVLIPLLVLAACFEPDGGPGTLRFDRDTCELCRMMISDPRFAAQVRGGADRKAYLFDDIGDAVNWLREQPWKDDPSVEIWVNDYDNPEQWLNAREAVYIRGVISPMDYGFAAVTPPRDDAVGFDAMAAAVLARGVTSLCVEDFGPVEEAASDASSIPFGGGPAPQ